MASGFLAPREATPVAPTSTAPTPQVATVTETVTYNVRGWAGTIAIAGALACCTGVLAGPGAILFVAGGLVWLLAPTNAARTQAMVDAPGRGCGAALAAVGGAVLVVTLAALAVGLMLVGGEL